MSGLALTCDRQGGLWRAAAWRGKELCDLYIDRIGQPDLTGAVVAGKVARLAKGQKAAWLDAGLGETIYVESAHVLRSGAIYSVKITSAARQGKAFGGHVLEDATKTGVLAPPPRPWERAILEAREPFGSLAFASREDHAACARWLEAHRPKMLPALKPVTTAPHAGLDEIIDGLLDPVVALGGGGNIVIETTEALVAIDVNGGDATNALAVNLQAVRETARQIRLRRLSGIIVIDALKSKARTDRAKVVHALEGSVADDPAGVKVFGMTKLGLVEMTRQRRGPSLAEILGR